MNITNDHNGLQASNLKPYRSKETEDILEHAVISYGFLCPFGKTINSNEWVKLIRQSYSSHPRIEAVIKVIESV
jgi:hypothetical protein